MTPDTIYIATVDTDYEVTAAAFTAEEAIVAACTFALAWLKRNGVSRFATADDVREYFDVVAKVVPVGTAVISSSVKCVR